MPELENNGNKSERELRCEQFIEAISCAELDDFYRVVLDAIPSPVLILEKDVTIVDYNAAASAILGKDRSLVLNKRAGEALHCLHSLDVPEGCGRGPACRECVIRNSVNQSLNGEVVLRKITKIEFSMEPESREATVLVTTSPLAYDERKYALLLLDDVSTVAPS